MNVPQVRVGHLDVDEPKEMFHMKTRTRPVSIRTVPERLDGTRKEAFYRDLESSINLDRPAIVLDCSSIRGLDRNTIQLMLCCLEEAMKRNGDVRLAAVSPELKKSLKLMELDALFQIFDCIGDAVVSFHRPKVSGTSIEEDGAGIQREMNAA